MECSSTLVPELKEAPGNGVLAISNQRCEGVDGHFAQVKFSGALVTYVHSLTGCSVAMILSMLFVIAFSFCCNYDDLALQCIPQTL